MEYLELISVPAIATAVYWIVELIKHCVGENEKFILDAVVKELCSGEYPPLFTKILDMFGDIVDVFKIIAV